MGRIEQIQEQLRQLPLEKQDEVLDFVSFLRQQLAAAQHCIRNRPLGQHPAFGSWSGRDIDALDYQRTLRSEWDGRE